MNTIRFRSSLRTTAFLLCALPVAGAVWSKGDKAAYDQAQATAKSTYDADAKQCDALSGNTKDICMAQAKLRRTTTQEQANAAYEGTAKAQEDAVNAIAKDQHSLAKEKCDDLGANPKDVCVKEADAAYAKAQADAKATRKTSEARKEAVSEKADANYEVAIKKCDALAGDAKTSCVNQAKTTYGK